MRKLAYVASALLGIMLGLSAQEAPKLKPEVSLGIRELQLQRAEQETRILVLEQQYQQAQQSVKELDAKLNEKLNTAVKDSGLDPDKYTVDAKTLAIQPRPVSHPPPPPGPPSVGGVKP